MKKEELLKGFLALTPEEQQEFVTAAMPIPSPSKLVYTDKDGKKEVLEVLVVARKNDITGIVSAGVEVALLNEDNSNWKDAKKKEKNGWLLPRHFEGETGRLFAGGKKLNETVEFLKKYGVNAELWKEGWYWCSEEYSEGNAYVFDMNTGRVGYGGKDAYGVYVRLVRAL